ncbi:hypothetical protein ACTOB_007924 [Actinoplanes oblitus]|uniref:DNA-binding protein n=1 Tax=Actinoplanes oblitus TaxID=3040509 RepID=A0ABY8WJ69_9ACTN|nr:hypothetical protein [Actinoplanes oblitus]WIM95790.1 hypothetical protein ACTOB_007924 [Actinoplanes oblitus]
MDDDQMVYVNFTETTEYSLELELVEMAKVLGIGKKKLATMIENGEDLEPSDAAVARMRKQAEVTDGQVTVDDFGEA